MDAACQASLSITNSWSLLRLMSIKSVMPSSHLRIIIKSHPQMWILVTSKYGWWVIVFLFMQFWTFLAVHSLVSLHKSNYSASSPPFPFPSPPGSFQSTEECLINIFWEQWTRMMCDAPIGGNLSAWSSSLVLATQRKSQLETSREWFFGGHAAIHLLSYEPDESFVWLSC